MAGDGIEKKPAGKASLSCLTSEQPMGDAGTEGPLPHAARWKTSPEQHSGQL